MKLYRLVQYLFKVPSWNPVKASRAVNDNQYVTFDFYVFFGLRFKL